MKPRSNIQKGKALENEMANLLVSYGIDKTAMRQVGSGSGLRKGDIHNSIGLTIECKNTKTFNWKAAAEQVKKESLGYGTEVIIWHPPQKPLDDSVAIINVHYYFELLKKSQEPKTAASLAENKAIRWKLQNLIRSAKEVLNELEI